MGIAQSMTPRCSVGLVRHICAVLARPCREDVVHPCGDGAPRAALQMLRCCRQVWDHIYLDGPEPAGSRIPAELLQTMRREFQFWCAATPHWQSGSRFLLRLQCLPATLPWFLGS